MFLFLEDRFFVICYAMQFFALHDFLVVGKLKLAATVVFCE